MSELKEARSKAQKALRHARALERLVFTEQFEDAWADATDAQKQELMGLLDSLDKAKVEAWVRKVLTDDLESKSVRELRELARNCGIDYYSHKSKDELISALRTA